MLEDLPPWFTALGASGAEGLGHNSTLLAALPPAILAVILVVLHRHWSSRSKLRGVLDRACPHPVVIARNGERFALGTVYVGEPVKHLTLVAHNVGQIVADPERY